MLGLAVEATLYAIPASHPCAAVERALELKGIGCRRVELIPVAHRLPQRLRFGGSTVPGLVLDDGTKLLGSRAIMRALEARVPAPPLFPADEDVRSRVERAEEWGDEVLQPLARRIVWAAVRRDPSALMSYTEGARLPVPRPVARLTAPLTARAAQYANHASDGAVRADLIGLDGHLERVEGWIADGVLGGVAEPNAADLQIGAGLALLGTLDDLVPALGDRPAMQLARRWFPHYPGHTPAGALPRKWVQPTRSGGPATRT
jgi:glutathione S-transferase